MLSVGAHINIDGTLETRNRGQYFLQFHAVYTGKKGKNNRLAPQLWVGATLYGILDPPLIKRIILDPHDVRTQSVR